MVQFFAAVDYDHPAVLNYVLTYQTRSGASMKCTIHKTNKRHAQPSSIGYLVVALVEQRYLVDFAEGETPAYGS